MKIGILGTRGIPNYYGGFEQFAQYLAEGLFKKGHDVYVYNSSLHPYAGNKWNGVTIIRCKDLEDKIGTAGQFIYDFNCIRDARNRNFDVLLQLGYTSNAIWYWLWPKKSTNIINMDGLEWKRSKYNRITRWFLKFSEQLAARHGDILVADSLAIQEYLKAEYNRTSMYIPYGADVFEPKNSEALKKYDLQPDAYYMLMARMEPENNIEMIIKGYLASKKDYPLVIVGNAQNRFGTYLQIEYPSMKLIFTGAIYEFDFISTLRYYSAIYFHGHSVGGTNPSLLEALACHCNIVAHNNVFNKAILMDCADYFSNSQEVANIINDAHDIKIILERKKKNTDKVNTLYNWKKIIDEYEKLFFEAFVKENKENN
jgi:glycosyltransferase involved in cell wall biosynthesis